MITYGSVCSGIEAATLAWEPLGWKAEWFAEIEKFPSAVLAHRWPAVPNYGDMTQLPHYIRNGWVPAPDVLVGGTPCQAFSVAGLREGLVDPRGALTIKFVEVADAIDSQRPGDECVIVWENVPGVLSSKDNAFGCFLAALVGECEALEPPGEKWTNAGCVVGPQRTATWRILDAQYFGVAQRRRRVFVVASAREGFDPTEVLFEREGVRRDTAPRREAGEEIARIAGTGATNGSAGHGARSGDSKDELIVPVCFTPSSINAYREGMGTLRANGGDLGGGSEGLICMAHGQAGAEIRSDGSPSLTCNHEAPIIAFNWNAQPDQMNFSSSSIPSLTCSQEPAVCQYGEVAGALTARHDSSPCADRGMNVICHPINTLTLGGRPDPANDARMTLGVGANGDPQFTLQANHPHAVAYGEPVAFCQNTRDEVRLMGGDGQIVGALAAEPGMKQTCYIAQQTHAICFEPGIAQPHRPAGRFVEECCTTLRRQMGDNQPAVAYGLTVRRLMPIECELLQGMPRNHTAIPGAADGPRYKAIGNSKAVPVVRWIGRRLQGVLDALL